MIRRLYLTMLFAAITLSGVAQVIDEAFYIYRNDGLFNAFFRDEVISIEYSYEDAEGNHYDEIVSQIINTTDSAYIIPLAVIDSVSFVKPQTKYKDDVVQMKSILPYVESVDGLILKLSSSIPSYLIPKVGDVLLYEEFDCDLFPDGFGGRVSQINGLQVVCDSVCIEDVYEEIISFGGYTAIDNETPARGLLFSSSRKKANMEVASSFQFKGTVGTSGATGFFISQTTEGKLSMDLRFVFQYSKGKPVYLNMSFSPKFSLKLLTTGEGKISKNIFENIAFEKNGLIGLSPFRWHLKCGPVLEGNFDASIKITTEAILGFNAGIKYENNEWKGYAMNTSMFSKPKLTGHLDGSVFGGVQAEISVISFFKILTGGISIKGGAEFVENLKQDLINIDNYEDLQNSHIDLNAKAQVEAKGKLKFNKWANLSANLQLLSLNTEIDTWKIVPSFQEPDVILNSPTSVTVSVKPSEELLGEVLVGVGVWKDDTVLISSQFSPDPYITPKKWEDNFKTTYYNLEPGKTYTVAPLVKISDQEIIAIPSKKFQTNQATSCPDDNHPHAIDLDISNGKVLWACCNVGASCPEDYGSYFAWGETSSKSNYNEETYTMKGKFVNKGIGGTENDAATVNWGAPWRMPSIGLFEDLLSCTFHEWTTQNGVSGFKFTSYNGASIFLPAAGLYTEDGFGYKGYGCYWSSTPIEGHEIGASGVYFNDGELKLCDIFGWLHGVGLGRYYGLSIRPIILKDE